MSYFSSMTTLVKDPKKINAVVMGRNTWDCIPLKYRPLIGRVNIVLTHHVDDIQQKVPKGVVVVGSLQEAVKYIEDREDIESTWVIGGSSVYKNDVALAAKRRSERQRKQRNRVGNKQKNEIRRLRQKVHDYQRKLRRIQKKKMTPNSKVNEHLNSNSEKKKRRRKLLFCEVIQNQLQENIERTKNDNENKVKNSDAKVVKNGDFVLVKYEINGKKYRYAGVCSSDFNDDEDDIRVTFLKICNDKGTLFKIDDNDVSDVKWEEILTILPVPKIAALSHPNCGKIYLTEIQKNFECDTFFPKFDREQFKLVEEDGVPADLQTEGDITYYFRVYEKI
ncbi:unnamed protein product [Chilo suppressalis]|uniref:dihydrofolate reductase n=1 Tax=Chilo suppressalis TaxID=168631 RepID=A0ABN8L5Y7_CHISP|nr:unnamed protein product [Chilo suppressalis]